MHNIETNYDSLIIKCQKYNKELKMKYNNIIKLNDIIINSYNKNKYQYYYINNILNEINFIQKYINQMPTISLQEIKNKYNVNINEEHIQIERPFMPNEGLKNIISIINKEKLINLSINTSFINNLDFLGNYNFSQLKIISIINCNINNIDNLKNIKCPKLIDLDLSNNCIKNINILKDCNLNTLESLNLSHNAINNINVFEEKVFVNLKKLNLSYNKIDDIKIFNKAKFTQIKTLILSFNNIKNVNEFNWSRLKNLTNLFLNNQSNIDNLSNNSN